MAAKKLFVRTQDLKPGMKLEQYIMDRMDRTLISKGAILDEKMIDGIKRRNIAGVYIYNGEENPNNAPKVEISKKAEEIIEKERVDDPAKVNLSESVKKRVSQGIQYLYNDTNSKEFADTSLSITQDLMGAIDSNDALAIDISTLKTSDEYTFKHSVDVATLSMIIAKKMGMSQSEIYDIGISGLLHDMGKSKIPLEILNKPGRLTDSEFAIMKDHSRLGYEILKDKKEFKQHIPITVLQHHEKMNGNGYPFGVKSDKIIGFAKILSVADVYDALVTERPYKKPFTQRNAVELIMSMTEELDITAMRAFLECVILYPVDSIVTLSNGETAKVIENKPHSVLRPTVVGTQSGKIYNLSEDLNCASIIIL